MLLALLHELIHIQVHVLEHQEELVVLADDLLQFDDVGMIELL